MILKIFPDTHPVLKKKCEQVVPAQHSKLASSMLATVKAKKALGLSANQVGKSLRIIALNTKSFKGIMFNPEIVEKSDDIFEFPEGCLSIKKKLVNTKTRSQTITVKWQLKDGTYNTKEFTDLDAVVIQHEIDHLDGILMTDYTEAK